MTDVWLNKSNGTHFYVQRVIWVTLDMGVNDGDHLAADAGDVVLHLFRAGEMLFVPSHVSLSICVLDVKPNHIARHLVLVEARAHRSNVCFVFVVPPATSVGVSAEISLRSPQKVINFISKNILIGSKYPRKKKLIFEKIFSACERHCLCQSQYIN